MGTVRTRTLPAHTRRVLTLAAGAVLLLLLVPLAVSRAGDIPIATVPVGNTPAAVTVNPVTHRVFVCNYFGDSVSVIDGNTNSVIATVSMPTTGAAAALPIAAVTDPTRGLTYVANWQSHKIVIIAEPSYTITAVVNVPTINSGNPRALALDPSSTPPRLYVANYSTDDVSVLNALTLALIKEIKVGDAPRTMGIFTSAGRRRVYVGNRGTNNVTIIDGVTDSVVGTVTLDGPPKALAVHPSTGVAYVTVPSTDKVVVIGAADTVDATVTVGDNPVGLAVLDSDNRLLVADYASNDVAAIDTNTNALIATAPVGPGPFFVSSDQGDRKWFVTNSLGSTVNSIDRDLVVTTVSVGAKPNAVASDEATTPHQAYCSNYDSDTVTVIDEPLAAPVGAAVPGVRSAYAAGGDVPRLAVSVDALPSARTTTSTTTFTGSVVGTTSPYELTVVGVWYRLETDPGWLRAEITSGAGTASVRWRADVSIPAAGAHTLQVMAMDQGMVAAASSAVEGSFAGVAAESPAAYAFEYVDTSGDTTPPVTSAPGLPGGWSSGDVTVILTATDTGGSGVASTWYTLNGGAPQLYTLPFSVSAEGTTTVAYWSVDLASNAEASQTADVRIDRTPPVTTSDAAASYVGTATVHLSASDAHSGVTGTAYSLDGGMWTTATTVVTGATGGHSLAYRSVDAAGNLETAGGVSFTVVEGSVADVPAGTGVVVSTPEGVTLAFDSVTSPGSVTIAHTGTGPGFPFNFRLAGAAYYDISVTAGFSGLVTVTVPYDENAITGREKNLKLFHRKLGGGWEDVTVAVDEAGNTITGRTSSFSPFGVGYSPWEPTSTSNAGSLPTPHKDYAIGTNKCAVCHSVHSAEAAGEVLLGVPAADACSYCHIETGIGIVRIYNGLVAAYSADASVGAFGGGFAHTRDGVTCQGCHSVHGAKTLDGGNTAKILKDWTFWRDMPAGFADYSTLALAKWPTPDDDADKYEQQAAWCTGCHKYYIESYDESATAVQYVDGAGWAFSGSHVMTATHADYGNPAASASVTQVAWAPSITCRACHNAGAVDTTGGIVANSFPHYTPSFYRFMGVGASTAETGSANTTGTIDGLCLKCHRDGVIDGVGEGF